MWHCLTKGARVEASELPSGSVDVRRPRPTLGPLDLSHSPPPPPRRSLVNNGWSEARPGTGTLLGPSNRYTENDMTFSRLVSSVVRSRVSIPAVST